MKQIYVTPNIKVLYLIGSPLLQSASKHEVGFDEPNVPSKGYVGGLDDEEDTGSSSPWD